MSLSLDLLQSALAYAVAGRPVFPVDLDKAPYIHRGFHNASTDEAKILKWWGAWPHAGIGTPTGPDWFVLDVDDAAALAALEAKHGPLPPTREVITPRPGRHLYFRGEVTNARGSLPQGIDVRGLGGYVVLPPSPHQKGRTYEWRNEDLDLAPAPAWLLTLINPPAQDGGPTPPVEGDIPSGERNQSLTSLAGAMQRKGTSQAGIIACLLQENRDRCKPPLAETEVRKIARSISRYKNSKDRGATEQSGAKGVGEGFPPLPSVSPPGSLRFPQPLGEAAYCGLAGRIVQAIAPHTEADPAALLGSLLVMFGNAVGRGAHFLAGDVPHATNLFVCVVGETSTGRKGTSAEGPRRLVVEADQQWGGCIASGLVSGEGIIHHVRDERRTRRKPKKGELAGTDGLVEEVEDVGAEDKRLLAMVPEFSQLLSVVARKDNTLSAVVRDLWDRGDVQTLAKNSPEKATGALVSILAHITPVELRSRLDSTEIANGFANRFLFIASRRSRLLSRGGSTPAQVVFDLVPELRSALRFASVAEAVDMTPEAWKLWDQHYESLTTRPPGLVGAVTGRAAPIVRRLALIYALLDESDEVDEQHLLASLELWRYVEQSVKWVFGERLGEQTADACLASLREADTEGLTRNELREVLGHRISSARITDALELLRTAGLAHMLKEPTAGRHAARWFAAGES